jgi:Rap1a immunity proteins
VWVVGVTVRQFSLPSSIGVVAAVVLTANLASAQRVNKDPASHILPGCRDFITTRKNDAFARGLCVGLVKVIFEYAPSICPPDGVKNDQIVRVVVNYIDGERARLEEDFNAMALEAMRKAWPCQR